MKFALVTTTINIPHLLNDYALNFKNFGWDDVIFVIAGDKKTPITIDNFCKDMESKFNYKVYYLDLEQQEKINADLHKYIPFNCPERRNFAILFAYLQNADVIITIDDDNLVTEEDYLNGHSIVGTNVNLNHVTTEHDWYNVCETLEEEKNRYFYHRGYPVNQRKSTNVKLSQKSSKIVVNAGLWIKSPDTDAISWLNFGEINVARFNHKIFGENFALGDKTWCPFNTQNTAIAREAIPALFLNPKPFRYSDVWSSLILRKIADHLSHSISYGYPIVMQERNSHNYIKDLKDELEGMERTPDLIEELRSIELTGNNYFDCTSELINKLSDKFEDLKEGYRIWLKILAK